MPRMLGATPPIGCLHLQALNPRWVCVLSAFAMGLSRLGFRDGATEEDRLKGIAGQGIRGGLARCLGELVGRDVWRSLLRRSAVARSSCWVQPTLYGARSQAHHNAGFVQPCAGLAGLADEGQQCLALLEGNHLEGNHFATSSNSARNFFCRISKAAVLASARSLRLKSRCSVALLACRWRRWLWECRALASEAAAPIAQKLCCHCRR